MADTRIDLFLGGILINPIEVFAMSYEPVLKGYRMDIYNICKEEFLMTGDVDLSSVYSKLKEKNSAFKVMILIDLASAYDGYREKRRMDNRDFGNAYCRWPRNEERIMERASEIYGWLEKAKAVSPVQPTARFDLEQTNSNLKSF